MAEARAVADEMPGRNGVRVAELDVANLGPGLPGNRLPGRIIGQHEAAVLIEQIEIGRDGQSATQVRYPTVTGAFLAGEADRSDACVEQPGAR